MKKKMKIYFTNRCVRIGTLFVKLGMTWQNMQAHRKFKHSFFVSDRQKTVWVVKR